MSQKSKRHAECVEDGASSPAKVEKIEDSCAIPTPSSCPSGSESDEIKEPCTEQLRSENESYIGAADEKDTAVLTEDNGSYQIMFAGGQQISIKDNVIEIHAVGNEQSGEETENVESEQNTNYSDLRPSDDSYVNEQDKNGYEGDMSTDGCVQSQPCQTFPTDQSRKFHYADEHCQDNCQAERLLSDDETGRVTEGVLPHISTFTSNPQDINNSMESSSGNQPITSGFQSSSYSSCTTPGASFDQFRRPVPPNSAISPDMQYGDRMLRAPGYPRMPHVRTPHPFHMMYMPSSSRNMLPPPSPNMYAGPMPPYGPSTPQTYHPSMSVQGVMGDNLNSSGEDQHSSPEYPSVPNNTPAGMMDGTPHRSIMGPLDNKAPLYVPQLHNMCTSVAAARQHHNAKERMRRARVKDACQLLRELVPGMTDKTDKATVFEYATQYILFVKEKIGKKFDREFLQKYSPY